MADVTITVEDCGALAGVEIRRAAEDKDGNAFATRLTGRVILHNLYRVGQSVVIVNAGKIISRAQALAIVANNIAHAHVRSPLECRAAEGICGRCFGADPATGKLIELHSAVGVKAALAIAPVVGAIYDTPSPRLRDPLIDDLVVATTAGVVSHGNLQTILRNKRRVVISTGGALEVYDENSRAVRHAIPQGVELYVETGADVERGAVLTSRTPSPRTILAPQDGVVRIERGERVGPGVLVSLVDSQGAVVDACLLPPDAMLLVDDGASVDAGAELAKFPLPYTNQLAVANGRFVRLRRLLEARSRAPRALLAEVDGEVELRPEPELRRHAILIHPPHGGPPAATHVAWRERRIIVVRTGQKVAVGDALTWGDLSPADLVRLRGDHVMRPLLWTEIEEQLAALEKARPLDNRPWELLLGQMLRYVEVQSPGDSRYEVGAVLSRGAVEAVNRSLRQKWRVADRKAYPIPLDADVLSKKIYDFATSSFAALHPGKPLPPAHRAWPVGWSCRLMGLRELAERGSYLAAGGLRPTRSSLVRAALDRCDERLDRRQHKILAGLCTRPEPM